MRFANLKKVLILYFEKTIKTRTFAVKIFEINQTLGKIMQKINITPYENKHHGGLINLVLPIQQIEFQVPITLEDQIDLQDAASYFRNYPKGKGEIWVALCDEEVVGSIGLINIGNGQTCLRKMFVRKDFRGKEHNIAQKLLQQYFDYMQSENLHSVFLGTREDLYAARRFYERNGFILIDKTELPVDFPIMSVDSHFYKYSK